MTSTSTSTSAGTDLQQAFTAAMDDLFADIAGTVGVCVHDYTHDLTLEYHADEVFPTASTLKIPLLYELYRQAEAGRIDLTSRVTLTAADRVPGSGVLQALDEGLQPTVRDLAELMITVSDNYATDLIYTMLGREQIAAMLRDLGLDQTHLPLTVKGLLSAIAGMDPDDPGTTYTALKEKLRKGPWDLEGIGYAADERNDVSSPRDMVRLLDLIHECHGISEESQAAMIQILKNQNFNTIIPARLPEDPEIQVAHKTGSIRGVRNDAGIVYSPKLTYAIAIMSKDLTDTVEAIPQFAKASRWVWDELSSPDEGADTEA